MADKLTLEVLIKTVLDAAGVKAGSAEIKQLTATLEKSSEAGKKLELTSDSIVKGLEQQRTAATQTGRAWDQLTAAEKEAHKETAQRSVRLLEADEAAKKASSSTKQLASNLGTLKQAGAGVQQIISGLLTGNLIAVAMGISSIQKAIVAASAATKAWLVDLALFTSAVAGLAAPFAIAIAAFREYANELEKANKRILDSARDTSELRKKILAEETAVIEAEYAKQVKAAQDAAAAAEEAQRRITAAYDRAAKKTTAERGLRDVKLDNEEKDALANAKTPADREKIQRDFARRRESSQASDKLAELNTSDYEGSVKSAEAQKAIDDAKQRNRDAQKGVLDAQEDFENKKSVAASYGAPVVSVKRGRNGETLSRSHYANTSPEAVEARKAALDAEKLLETRKAKAGEVESETSKTIAVNDAIITQAKDTKERVAIQRETLKAILQQNAKEASRKGADAESKKDAQATNDVLADDEAGPAPMKVKQTGSTIEIGGRKISGGAAAAAEIARLREELSNRDREQAAGMKATTEAVKKSTAKAKATREGGGF